MAGPRKLSKALRNDLSQGQVYTPAPGQDLPGFYTNNGNPFMGGKPRPSSRSLPDDFWKSELQMDFEKSLKPGKPTGNPAEPMTHSTSENARPPNKATGPKITKARKLHGNSKTK